MIEFFQKLLDTSDWPPRWLCGEWTEFHGWLYIISDLLIWAAYFSMPILILKYILRKRDVRFYKLYILFAAFILACGSTHFIDAITFWIPVYRLNALFRFVTAIVSWITVFYLIRYLPIAFSLRSEDSLEADIRERTASLEMSRRETMDYKYALDESSIVAITDQKGIIKHVNENFCHISKYSREELIGQDHRIINSGHHSKEFIRNIWTTIANGKIWKGELKNKAKDGTIYWVDTTIVPFLNEAGKPYQYVAIRSDITERKKVEEEVYELNAELDKKVLNRTDELLRSKNELAEILEHSRFLASIADNIEDPVITSDNNSIITSWNHTAEKLLEWKSEEVVGKNVAEILQVNYPNETRTEILASFSEKGYWRGEVVYHTKSGKQVNVLATASKLKDLKGNVTGNLVLARDITERKKAEAALSKLNEELEQRVLERTTQIQENETRFRVLVENNEDIISLTDEALNSIYRSPSFERITGWTPDDLKVNGGISYFHPSDIIIFENAFAEAIKNPGIPHPYKGRYLHKNGHYIWVEGTVTKLPAESIIKGLVVNSRDVTDRIELELLLAKTNSLARIGSWEVDLIKGTVFWSEITREIHETEPGYIPDLATGINFYKEGIGRDLIKQKVQAAIESGTPWNVELQIVTAKNNERWIRSIGEAEFVEGKCVRIYGGFQDIDERKKAEIESERLNERFQLATQSAQLGLWDWDVKNNKLIWDEAMYRLYNLTENEFSTVYDGWIYRVHEEDRQQVDNEIQLALADKKEYNPEFRIVWPDSSVHYINASGIIERDSDGNAVRMTGFNWDVTERKKAEQVIKSLNENLEAKVIERTAQLESVNRELEAFSYSISHDLRAPLRAINGYARMLEEDYYTIFDENGKRLLGIVQKNAHQMGTLIDDLLSLSRLGRKEIQKSLVDMKGLTQSILDELPDLDTSPVQLTLENLHPIQGDHTLLKQVLINLISNALKYSSKTINPIIAIRSAQKENEVIYSIADNGSGFDMAYANKLFGVFQRLHSQEEFEGTGVGLAIVKLIIEKHKGKVWAEGMVEKGATFHFSLPTE